MERTGIVYIKYKDLCGELTWDIYKEGGKGMMNIGNTNMVGYITSIMSYFKKNKDFFYI